METIAEKLHRVLITDCGSTTTKALLFEKGPAGWRTKFRGEAPTTVEEPVADVTVGALNAFAEIEELSGIPLLAEGAAADGNTPFRPLSPDHSSGIDLYLSTSSAGGGLQMIVTGVVSKMTTESAARAALGAGAIIMESFSADDPREDHDKIERIRHLRPDIVLLCGGVDGGSVSHVSEMAEILLAASPRPRFGNTLKLPVIFAGNADAAPEVKKILGESSQVSVVANVRPTLEEENLRPARDEIHDFFLSHVMSHSPGYGKLMRWSPLPIVPTPAAVGDIVRSFAERRKLSVLCADIGGATTDVFSVFPNTEGELIFNRTVSANLGMSYSVANVMLEAGIENIRRWLAFSEPAEEIRDRLRNKMIRPTSIPQTRDDLALEQGVCREALRLSLEHHRSLAVGLSGSQRKRGIADIFSQSINRYELVDLMKLDLVIGSGGVLSHAPERLQAAIMMLEGFGLEGVTEIAVDSIFMMPHLGVLAGVHPEASEEIFIADCLIHICHAIVPLFRPTVRSGELLATIFFNGESVGEVRCDQLCSIGLPEGEQGTLVVHPAGRHIDTGAGPGERLVREIQVGQHGLLCDGRNRPMRWSSDAQENRKRRVAVETIQGGEQWDGR